MRKLNKKDLKYTYSIGVQIIHSILSFHKVPNGKTQIHKTSQINLERSIPDKKSSRQTQGT